MYRSFRFLSRIGLALLALLLAACGAASEAPAAAPVPASPTPRPIVKSTDLPTVTPIVPPTPTIIPATPTPDTRTIDLSAPGVNPLTGEAVPANSEIVIEGYVDPSQRLMEGPFGDHTGFYSLPDRYPLLRVTALTHMRGATYPPTIVGVPPQEDYYLGKATERIFLPLLRTLIHDIADYHLPLFGCFHNCAFVKIRKEYPLQARRVMCSVWGAGQMAWTKVVIVVDDDVDVHDERAVWRAVFENCDFGRDIEIVNGPLDILDHAAPRLGAGHKVGIDATRKIAGEEVRGIPLSGPPR